MAKVVLKNVCKNFESPEGLKKVVKNISFTCEDKEFVILVGPSGCGKSTTLRMIAGLEDVSAGEIHIGGQMVNEVVSHDRDIAMVFQNYALYPHMNVFSNMAFGLRLQHLPKKEIEKRVMEAAEILRITEHLTKLPKGLSGGERQRVAVGRAIVRKPKVFLFDEPLSNLDAEMRESMRADIRQLHSILKATMIYVTHDQIEAMTMADRIVVLKKGEVHQFDKPLNLYKKPCNKFVAGFIGNQRMNFIPGELIKKGKDIYFFNEHLTLKTHTTHAKTLSKRIGQKTTMGIRPENIYDKIYAANASAGNTLKAKIKVMLPTGEYAILHLQAGEQTIITKVNTYDKLSENKQIDIVLDMGKAHYFEPRPDKVDPEKNQTGLEKVIC
ncbi:ABC transporter ATP-binding protein [bacterium]|nr:ABC transporter ATP-binding protein [bacterium]